MNHNSQCNRLLKALKKGPINPLKAWSDLAIYRLGARIFDLRESGHNIGRRMITVTNRFGEDCRVAEYYLEAKK